MHEGKLVFSQLTDYLPLHTFRRCVQRYQGEQYVKKFRCLDQYLVMAFAQLTYREGLRGIEACLRAQQNKLYHMGIRTRVSRSTLADANEQRDWRLYADFAQALIKIARPLYAKEDLGLDLDNTVYALDASTIDLCLSVFPWALFRATKSAVKLHTLLDLRGNIPTFIHISDGKLHDVNVLDILITEPGAFYIMDRGYVDFERLFTLNQAGSFFVIRAKRNTGICRFRATVYTQSGGKLLRHSGQAQYPVQTPILPCYRYIQWTEMRSVHRSNGGQHKGRLSSAITTSQIPRQQDRKDLQLSDQQLRHSSADHSRSLSLSMAGRALFQMDQTALEDQILFWHLRECREESDLDRHFSLCSGGYHQKATRYRDGSLHNFTDFEPGTIRAYSIGSITYETGLPGRKLRYG